MTHCLSCGAPLVGRSDKRFCDDACRSGYHNKKCREDNGVILRINKILKKNRNILAACYHRGTQLVPMKKVLEEGFLLEYCTAIEPLGRKESIRYCYEYGYKMLRKNYIEISRKE